MDEIFRLFAIALEWLAYVFAGQLVLFVLIIAIKWRLHGRASALSYAGRVVDGLFWLLNPPRKP
jgi:hypothetical protein